MPQKTISGSSITVNQHSGGFIDSALSKECDTK